MQLTITMNLDNATMLDDDGQPDGIAVADELRVVADLIEDAGITPTSRPVRDANGNTIGQFTVTED